MTKSLKDLTFDELDAEMTKIQRKHEIIDTEAGKEKLRNSYKELLNSHKDKTKRFGDPVYKIRNLFVKPITMEQLEKDITAAPAKFTREEERITQILSTQIAEIRQELTEAKEQLHKGLQPQLKNDAYHVVSSLLKALPDQPQDYKTNKKAILNFSKSFTQANKSILNSYYKPASTFMQKLKTFLAFCKPKPNIEKMAKLISKQKPIQEPIVSETPRKKSRR